MYSYQNGLFSEPEVLVHLLCHESRQERHEPAHRLQELAASTKTDTCK